MSRTPSTSKTAAPPLHRAASVGSASPIATAPREVRVAPDTEVALLVTVSERNGIDAYNFAYAGVPVPMSSGRGTFYATKGRQGRLEWAMIGEGGGTMKVVVTRDGELVKQRDKSTIPNPGPGGFDAFQILVS